MPTSFNEEDAERLIQEYISNIFDKKKPPVCADIVDFFPVLQNALRTREEEDQIPEDRRLLLLEEDPPEVIDTEAITWSLWSRRPGQFSEGPAGSSKVKEVVPHLRAVQEHPDHPSEKLITMGKFYDNWIKFDIYARDTKTAMNRLLWFEKTIDSFRWYFRLYGFNVIEEEVGRKEKVVIDKLELVKYPVIYFVRSEDTYFVTTQELKRILVKHSVSKF